MKNKIQLEVEFQLEKEELKHKWLLGDLTTEQFLLEKNVLETELDYQKSLLICKNSR